MNMLITGGAGFVGSHLADHLLANGHRVTALDNLSTGSSENIAHLLSHDRFQLVEGSVLDESLLTELVGEADRVFHLAAAVGVKYIMQRPVQSLIVNARGTENVLSAAAKAGTRVLIASSSEVYGKQATDALSEDCDRVYGPTSVKRWGYACSKAFDEFLSLAYREELGVEVVIVRLFNTVGPRQSGQYGMVIPALVKQALSGPEMTVYGTGEQTRSFTYVGDVVRAMDQLLDCDEALGEVVNIGNGKEISMLDLARRIKAMTGSEAPIRLVPYEEAYGPGYEDMQQRTPDITKIARLIGYRPEVDLDGILERVIAYERERAAAEKSVNRV